MFETILALPLFQGLSYDDVTRIVESVPLGFETRSADEVVCRQDAQCTHVYFVIEGSLSTHTYAADRTWAVEEVEPAGAVVGLEVLFGRRRSYRSTCTAVGRVRLLVVDKRTMGALFRYFEVMQLNAFNRLTSDIARYEQRLWLPPATTLEGRIVSFMQAHVVRPAGWKRFTISHATLGSYLGEDQRYVSRALHRMQEASLLKLGRKSIEVEAVEKLTLGG